jgi:hypothetical protein
MNVKIDLTYRFGLCIDNIKYLMNLTIILLFSLISMSCLRKTGQIFFFQIYAGNIIFYVTYFIICVYYYYYYYIKPENLVSVTQKKPTKNKQTVKYIRITILS